MTLRNTLQRWPIIILEVDRVIHQSPDTSNHRTPSKYRTEIQVIPTSIHLRLLPAESAFTAARNVNLLHQGFDCCARQASHFTHVELAVFFPGSTKCKSIATVRTCVWQQIQVSKRLVPASPFTCYIFHGFATRLSGCTIIFLKDFLLVQLSLRLHGLATRLCSRRKSAVRS